MTSPYYTHICLLPLCSTNTTNTPFGGVWTCWSYSPQYTKSSFLQTLHICAVFISEYLCETLLTILCIVFLNSIHSEVIPGSALFSCLEYKLQNRIIFFTSQEAGKHQCFRSEESHWEQKISDSLKLDFFEDYAWFFQSLSACPCLNLTSIKWDHHYL